MDYYKEFDDYVKKYDINDKDIKLKYNHSYRVMELAKKYSNLLKYSNHDKELATLIGLLHDIGRFEQIQRFHTYNDKSSMDHADYGVKVLFDDNLIENFTKNKEDYEIIKFSIKNHNKLKIPVIDDEKMMMHARLIRDLDKLDIIYLEGKLDEQKLRTTDDEISNEVIESIKNHKNVDLKYVKNRNDHLALFFSYVFDINNDIVLEEFKKNIKWYYENVDRNNKFKEIFDIVNKYIDERIDNYVRNKI